MSSPDWGPLDPAELVFRARTVAFRSEEELRQSIKPWRDPYMERFLDAVDPNRELPQRERQRRAKHARKAYFTELAYKSSRARSKK